jgi:hypothetical protein
MRLRNLLATGKMVNKDGGMGYRPEPPSSVQEWYWTRWFQYEDTVAPEYRGRPPQSHLEDAERDNPDGGLVERKGRYPSGQ